MSERSTTIDYSRTFHVDVEGGEVTVRIWSDNTAGFACECTASDITQALQKILAGRAIEQRGRNGDLSNGGTASHE